jgi:hypothetical protein
MGDKMQYKIDKLKIVWDNSSVVNTFEIGFHEKSNDEPAHTITIEENNHDFQIKKTTILDSDEIMAIAPTEILVIPKIKLRKWFIIPQP